MEADFYYQSEKTNNNNKKNKKSRTFKILGKNQTEFTNIDFPKNNPIFILFNKFIYFLFI